jgi:hypothetical protein
VSMLGQSMAGEFSLIAIVLRRGVPAPNGLAFSGTSGRAKRVTRSVRCNALLGDCDRK